MDKSLLFKHHDEATVKTRTAFPLMWPLFSVRNARSSASLALFDESFAARRIT